MSEDYHWPAEIERLDYFRSVWSFLLPFVAFR